MEQYIFIDSGGGYARPSGFALIDGSAVYVGTMADGVEAPAKVAISKLKNNGLAIVMSPKQFQAKINNSKTMAKDYSKSTINVAETVSGKKALYREEVAGDFSNLQTLTVTLDGSAIGAGESVVFLLGDGAKGIEYAGGGTSDPTYSGLVVDGNFGANTANWIKNKVNGGAIRLKTMQLTSGGKNANTYFNKGTVVQALSIDSQAAIKRANINMNINQDGSQFQQFIRRFPNFRFLLSNDTALGIRIDSGDILTLTFQYVSDSEAHGMVLAQ